MIIPLCCRRPAWLALAVILTVFPTALNAHCDTMDGPVVKAAQKALATNNVDLVLIWVQPKDEKDIRDAFARAMEVRKAGPEARDLADLWFFETLVRVHRAGEGVAYTGLKPAGTEVEHGIVAADQALETGSAGKLVEHLSEAVHQGLHERFTAVMSKKSFAPNDVASGREYVKAYVEFIHYAERLVQATAAPAGDHHGQHE